MVMFWTLVVLTAGGEPIPTDLVYDSIDACYQAAEWMGGEYSEYNNALVGELAGTPAMKDFRRPLTTSGVCIPHSPTSTIDNLSTWPTSKDPGRWHELAPLGKGTGPAVEYAIAAQLNYELPEVRVTFRMRVRNPARHAVNIRNPVQMLWLTFHKPDGTRVDLPEREPVDVSDPVDPLNDKPAKSPSPVEFRMAIVNGQQEATERSGYRIEPRSSMEIVFDCEAGVGGKIAATLADFSDKHVDVSAHMLATFAKGPGVTTFRLYDKVRLPFRKP